MLAIPDMAGGSLVLKMNATAHFAMRKLNGSDRGFYAVSCPDSNSAIVGVSGTSEAARQESGGGGLNPLLVSAAFGGLLLLTATTALFWRLAGARASAESESIIARPDGSVDGHLTDRKKEVVVLVSRGLTNRQIAEQLTISQGTAKRHVENILRKLGLESRTQVATWAANNGWSDESHDGSDQT